MNNLPHNKFLKDECYTNEYAIQVVHSPRNKRLGLYCEYIFDRNKKGIEQRINAFFQLSSELQKPIAVMTSPPPGSGVHWVLMYFINQNNLLYIDSFGRSKTELETITSNLGKTLYVSTTKTQTDANSCGPISTELAMHFQGEYFFNELALLNPIQEKANGQDALVKEVDLEDLLPQIVKNCRKGNSYEIRKEHNNLITYGQNTNLPPIIDAVSSIIHNLEYYEISQEEKINKFVTIKQNILDNAKSINDDSYKNKLKENLTKVSGCLENDPITNFSELFPDPKHAKLPDLITDLRIFIESQYKKQQEQNQKSQKDIMEEFGEIKKKILDSAESINDEIYKKKLRKGLTEVSDSLLNGKRIKDLRDFLNDLHPDKKYQKLPESIKTLKFLVDAQYQKQQKKDYEVYMKSIRNHINNLQTKHREQCTDSGYDTSGRNTPSPNQVATDVQAQTKSPSLLTQQHITSCAHVVSSKNQSNFNPNTWLTALSITSAIAFCASTFCLSTVRKNKALPIMMLVVFYISGITALFSTALAITQNKEASTNIDDASCSSQFSVDNNR